MILVGKALAAEDFMESSLYSTEYRRRFRSAMKIRVIGIGAGHPEQITLQAINAIQQTDVLFITDKGAEKDDLARFRRETIERYAPDKSASSRYPTPPATAIQATIRRPWKRGTINAPPYTNPCSASTSNPTQPAPFSSGAIPHCTTAPSGYCKPCAPD